MAQTAIVGPCFAMMLLTLGVWEVDAAQGAAAWVFVAFRALHGAAHVSG